MMMDSGWGLWLATATFPSTSWHYALQEPKQHLHERKQRPVFGSLTHTLQRLWEEGGACRGAKEASTPPPSQPGGLFAVFATMAPSAKGHLRLTNMRSCPNLVKPSDTKLPCLGVEPTIIKHLSWNLSPLPAKKKQTRTNGNTPPSSEAGLVVAMAIITKTNDTIRIRTITVIVVIRN